LLLTNWPNIAVGRAGRGQRTLVREVPEMGGLAIIRKLAGAPAS